MSTEKTDPWALLHEAQPHVAFNVARNPQTDTGLLARIDAALAEVNPCRLIDVGDGGMSRERAEADAFRRGVQAGREQVISYLGLQAAVFAVNVEQMQKNIRTMQFPEDK
jgi:hypothetical protein